MSEIVAAGGVLWRPADTREGREIAIIHRPKYDDWSLPKGKLDPGETPIEAATREVWEETGFRAHVGVSLGFIHYLRATRKGGSHDKIVHYWAMAVAGGAFAASGEVDALEWAAPTRAARRVTYQMDREVIERFLWSFASA